MTKPTLSIIIVSYNTKKIIKNCIDSVFKDKGLSFNLNQTSTDATIPTEIIIVDNASTDSSTTLLKKLPLIKLIKNSKNIGYARANNQGIKKAQGNYILLLNPDTFILHSSISQSLNWFSSHPEASACTAQLLNPDKTIQASGGFFPNLANVITWSFGLDDLPLINKIIRPLHPHTPHFYTKDKFYLFDHPQDWITGAFILIRASTVTSTGLLDPDYFMYGEELEWCYRIKKKDPQTQTWYLVGPQIIHLGGASSKNKAISILREYQGIIAFFKKHRPQYQYKIVKILLKLNASLRSLFYLVTINKKSFINYQQACRQL